MVHHGTAFGTIKVRHLSFCSFSRFRSCSSARLDNAMDKLQHAFSLVTFRRHTEALALLQDISASVDSLERDVADAILPSAGRLAVRRMLERVNEWRVYVDETPWVLWAGLCTVALCTGIIVYI